MTPPPPVTPPGLGVPAYFGPWERRSWEALVRSSPSVVVINPATGPGSRRHSGYRPLVQSLRRRGTTVLGYVTTAWSSKSTEEVAHELRRHREWYGVDGAFLDEVAFDRGAPARIRSLASIAAGGGLGTIAFNPGREIPPSWRRAAPGAWWVTFEGTGRSYLEREHTTSAARDWHLVHSVSTRDRRRVVERLAERAPGLGYVTGDRLPNPWDLYEP